MSDVKLRPALLLSNADFNSKKNIILMAISTKSGDNQFCLELHQEDLQEGTLNKKSFLRFQNVLTIEKRLVTKTIAKIKKEKLVFINQKYQSFFTVLEEK